MRATQAPLRAVNTHRKSKRPGSRVRSLVNDRPPAYNPPMPRSTLGGDDDQHDLPPEEKDRIEREFRAKARRLLLSGQTRARRELQNRATNISRRPSRRGHQQ